MTSMIPVPVVLQISTEAARMIRVVGSVVMDLISRADKVPVLGETVIGKASLSLRVGGKGFNQAIFASRALKQNLESRPTDKLTTKNIVVGFEGAIGNDAFGFAARRVLDLNDIHHRMLVSSKSSTGTGSIHLQQDGDNCIVVSPGANNEFSYQHDDLVSSPFELCDVVIGQLELPLSATLHAFTSCTSSRVVKILNAAPVPRQISSELAQLLAISDIIVVNRGEADALNLVDHEGRISHTCSKAKVVIVTLGKDGARIHRSTGIPVKVTGTPDVAVDSIGAGDCFVSSLAVNTLLAGSHDSTHWSASVESSVFQANMMAGKYVAEVKKEMTLQEALEPYHRRVTA